MRSRIEQLFVWRKHFMLGGFLRGSPRSKRAVAWTVLLMVIASVVFAQDTAVAAAVGTAVGTGVRTGAATGESTPQPEVIAASLQDTPQTPDDAPTGEQEPPSADTPTGEPEPAPSETPEPPDETAVPTPDETPEPPTETTEPTPDDAPTGEPEPATETSEPTPDETPEPPTATREPTPGDTSEPTVETPGLEATAEETPALEKTVEAIATETAAAAETAAAIDTAIATAAATLTPTPAISIWPTAWPLGTVRFGAEEAGPPAEPVRVTMAEWLRLVLAMVLVILIAIPGENVLYRLLRSALKRRHLKVDETLLLELKPMLSWWLAAIGFHIAVRWVNFENEPARELFADLAFFVYLGVATLTVWRLVDRAIDLYARRIAAEGQAATIEKLRPLLRRWARTLILLLSALVGLGRLHVGFSVPTILVMLIGLTISLAARDTVTDIIAGFSILIDQPFRIGDRIEVQGVDTWAEVVSIGLRTSVLLTRHNVEIIVPNSTIGKNQVINYSYPDPRYRMQTHVGIAFGTSVEYARRVLIDAVRQVPYVLPGEPVEALYVEIGDSAMIFRVRWWIDFHQDWERVYDCVHTALHNALAEAGIQSPYPSQSLALQVDDQTLAEVWQVWQEEGESGSTG